MRIFFHLMSDRAIPITNPARAALGICLTMSNPKIEVLKISTDRPIAQKIAVIMEENRDLAPELKLRADRVSEPEAAMGVIKDAAMFAKPTESMSWFTSVRSPV